MAAQTHHEYQYKHFKASVPERRIFVGIVDQLEWRYYDTAPKSGLPPLVCLGGVAATSDVFYKQMLALSGRGYRVLAMDAPAIWSHDKWVRGFDHFLDTLRIHQVHLYGTSLGGFLFQVYALQRPRRVLSLVVSNTFLDTRAFNTVFGPWANMFQWAPDFLLKRLVLTGLKEGPHEPMIADSIDFVVARMDQKLSRAELASRLSLNTQLASCAPLQLPDSHVTIMDCNDFAAVPGPLRDAVYQRYPEARQAHLKSGGDFPFLSRADEVNLHLLLHLRRVHAPHVGPQDEEALEQESQRSDAGGASGPGSGFSGGRAHRRAPSGGSSGSGRGMEEVPGRGRREEGRGPGLGQDEGGENEDPAGAEEGGACGQENGLLGGSHGAILKDMEDPLGVCVSSSRGSQGASGITEEFQEPLGLGTHMQDEGMYEDDGGEARDLHVVHQSSWDSGARGGEDEAQAQVQAAGAAAAHSAAGQALPDSGEYTVVWASNSPLALPEATEKEPEQEVHEEHEHEHAAKSPATAHRLDMGKQAREWLRGVEEEHYAWEGDGGAVAQARDWLRDVEKDH